jgi:hypothetical protein
MGCKIDNRRLEDLFKDWRFHDNLAVDLCRSIVTAIKQKISEFVVLA